MIPMIWLKCQLLLGLAAVLLEPVHLGGEYRLGRSSGVDAIGLNGNEDVTVVLEEVRCVQGDDA